jgi:hypothetical protein
VEVDKVAGALPVLAAWEFFRLPSEKFVGVSPASDAGEALRAKLESLVSRPVIAGFRWAMSAELWH